MIDVLKQSSAITEAAIAAMTAAHQTLIGQIEPLEKDVLEVEENLSKAKAAITQMKAAAKELARPEKKKPKGSRKPSLPSAKKEDVRPVCIALVKDNPGIEKEVLAALAEEKLVEEQGFSRNGVKLQIDKCLKSSLFAIGSDGMVAMRAAEASKEAHDRTVSTIPEG